MWVRKAEKHLLHAAPPEVLAKVPHCVRPNDCDVLKVAWFLYPKSKYLLSHVIDDLSSDLQAKRELLRKFFRKGKQQSSETASNV